ncbi:unnamed protein product, partial [Amoebophrya sp. A25]
KDENFYRPDEDDSAAGQGAPHAASVAPSGSTTAPPGVLCTSSSSSTCETIVLLRVSMRGNGWNIEKKLFWAVRTVEREDDHRPSTPSARKGWSSSTKVSYRLLEQAFGEVDLEAFGGEDSSIFGGQSHKPIDAGRRWLPWFLLEDGSQEVIFFKMS